MTTRLRRPHANYGRMTTQNSRDRMIFIATRSTKIRWRKPKIEFNLKLEAPTPKITGRIITPQCINNNILITLSISICKKYIFVTEYDLKTDLKKNTYQIELENQFSGPLNYVFHFDDDNNDLN